MYIKITFPILCFVLLTAQAFTFSPAAQTAGPDVPADIQALLEKHGCAACHAMGRKLVGPMWPEIAAKKYTAKRIAQLVAKPEPANWPGYVPMAAQNVPKADMKKIADWLVSMK
jgi:cytochrome c551/c552